VQHRTGQVAGLVLALAVAATGCGDEITPASGDGTVTASGEDLEGRTYTSTEVRGSELVEGTVVTLTFAGGQLGASAGCNAMSGPARWHEGRLA
jgi:heat shock protein HslJ